jgi:dCMP deaminase
MDTGTAEKYYRLALYHAELFGKDPSRKVAAILLAPDTLRVLSTGVNGMCREHAETPERWERPAKYRWVCHAEIDAIATAARAGIKIEDSTCVVTLFPCVECTKAMIQSGVRTLVTRQPDWNDATWGEDFRISLEMLAESAVSIVYVDV